MASFLGIPIIDRMVALESFTPKASDLSTFNVVLFVFAVYLVSRVVLVLIRRRASLPLPPGPRPLPLVGNLTDFPTGHEGLHWSGFKEKYGPISSVRVFGTILIIVNDRKIASEFCDKRSAIYSDRPVFPFGGEMVGFSRWLTPLKRYDNELKLHRKFAHNYIGTRAASTRFQKLQEIETRRFLLQVFNKPNDFMDCIRRLPGTIILKMMFGYTTNFEDSDPLVTLADRVVSDLFSKTCAFGSRVVDVLPSLQYLPSWLPGMGFKRQARLWARELDTFLTVPYAFVRRQMANGSSKDSFISENIEKGIPNEVGEDVLIAAASSLYAGGSDTSVAALQTFYLCMVLNPAVLKRAQEEIDRVVGPDRLPTFSDRENLPFIVALLKETLRWQTVVPFGPRSVMADDTYMGYSIPKGALVIANLWHMAHDPDYYHDPAAFKPERFLGENAELDPRTYVFGFGRRICPGKDFADNSLFIAIAMSVAVFDIKKARDQFGAEVEPRCEFPDGLISHPKPFECSIKPRSEKAAQLILSILDDHPPEKGDGDLLKSL